MSPEWTVPVALAMIGFVWAFIRSYTKTSILESEARHKDEQIADLKRENEVLRDRVSKTK